MLRALLRDRNGDVEPAERVDEPALARLLAGPHAALRHRVDLLRRRLARLGGLLDEVVVEALHVILQPVRAAPA